MRVFRALALLLSWQFLCGPLAQNLGPIGVPFVYAKTAAECQAEGRTLDSATGRCVQDERTLIINANTRECANNEDAAASGDCVMSNVQGAIQEDGVLPGNRVNGNGSGITQTMRTMFPYMISWAMVTQALKGEKCTAPSYQLLMYGGLVLGIGEITATTMYNIKMRKLAKRFRNKIRDPELAPSTDDEDDETTTPTTQTGSENNDFQVVGQQQYDSFTFLMKQEKIREKTEKVRAAMYLTATAMYTAGAIAGVVEAMNSSVGANYTCTGTSSSSGDTEELENMNLDSEGAARRGSMDFLNEQFSTSLNYKTPVLNRSQKPLEQHNQEQSFSSFQMKFNETYAKTEFLIDYNLKGKLKKPDGVDWQQLTKEEMLDLTVRNVFEIIFPSAHARGGPEYIDLDYDPKVWKNVLSQFSGLIIGGAAGALVGSLSTKIQGLLQEPITRIVLGSVLAVNAGVVGSLSIVDARNAHDRYVAIKEMRTRLENSGGPGLDQCESRDDQSKPLCYCYLFPTGRNESRASSAICKSTWSRLPDFKGGNYDDTDLIGTDRPICTNNRQQMDPNCNCQQTNTCLRISTNIRLPGLKGASWMNEPGNVANSVTTGRTGAGNLDPAAMQRMAMRMKSNKDKMLENPKLKGLAAKIANGEKLLTKSLENSAQKFLSTPAGQNFAKGMMSSKGGSDSKAMDPKEAVEKAKKEMLQTTIPRSNGATDKKDDFDFGLGADSTGPGVTVDDTMASAMNKNYEYTGDIHNNSSTNIFHILSNRYFRSALPRFFDDKGVAIKDEASDSDISQ